MDLSCLAADHPEMKMMSLDAHTWMVRLALRKAVAAAQGIDNDEPSLVTLRIVEDTTSKDPDLAVKCDKSMPMNDPVLDAVERATDQGPGRQVSPDGVVHRSPGHHNARRSLQHFNSSPRWGGRPVLGVPPSVSRNAISAEPDNCPRTEFSAKQFFADRPPSSTELLRRAAETDPEAASLP